jgi:transposase
MTEQSFQKLVKQFKVMFDKTLPKNNSSKAEAEACQQAMKKMAEKFKADMEFDFTTGIATRKQGMSAGSQQANTGSQQSAGSQAGKQSASSNTGTWTTKDLADYISKMTGKAMTAKALRRILRANWYNDGINTHYSWTGKDDAMVKEILAFILGKAKASA